MTRKIFMTTLATLAIWSLVKAATKEVIIKDTATSAKIVTTTDPVVSTKTVNYNDLIAQISRANSEALKAIKTLNDLQAKKQKFDDLGIKPNVDPPVIDTTTVVDPGIGIGVNP